MYWSFVSADAGIVDAHLAQLVALAQAQGDGFFGVAVGQLANTRALIVHNGQAADRVWHHRIDMENKGWGCWGCRSRGIQHKSKAMVSL